MKLGIFIMGFLGFFLLSSAQEIQLIDDSGNQVESIVEFGQIEKGGLAEKEITIQNTGDKPLIIEKVQASCGCTVPSYPKEPIAPGESAKMQIKYTKTSSQGNFNKTVTVYSNSISSERKIFRIKGEIL